ncbi:MAG: flavin reductase family protein [Planctomycetes bacterium]|nr:flavin reductase family protein [Planctomycetota bacterium]
MYLDVTKPGFDWRVGYKLFVGFVNPRPIALVSTINAAGQLNLAPFSFYNMVSGNPPVVMFCPSLNRNREPKHTYRNIAETGEFVIATVSEAIAPQMARTAAELPYGQSEFEFSGLTPAAAQLVKAPLVKESPMNLECRLRQIVAFGDQPAAGQVIFGDVLAAHIDDAVLTAERDQIDPRKLRTVGRLGGSYYCTVTEPWSLETPKV